MALDPREILRSRKDEEGDAPSVPLGGTRRQRMQRLQIGLVGLGAMVLLVGLANILIMSAQRNQAAAVPEAVPTVAPQKASSPARDPLADAGVVPDFPATREEAQEAAAAAAPQEPRDVPPPSAQN